MGPRRDDSTQIEPPEILADQRIGPYRLLQKLGEGGMGEVWLAEQSEPIQRRVALKVVKRGMDSREVVARFEAERQALALMDHPCIAKVHDAGETPRGRPYFVMEYVKGVPITEYCDRHRLSTRERLELFLRVCEGVQHAHQKAVIHRDLKPTNILVTVQDDRPLPKIIDFGVAKATTQRLTEKTMFTQLGQLIGTPEYMSPEQAEMTGEDVDTRTDIYSLGVILYELLVGALPFDSRELRSAGFDGIRRIIREQEPARPSTRLSTLGEESTQIATARRTEARRLSSQLRGDLDWIILKALEKERSRRYDTANALSMDLRRHLNDEPVLASPPSASYRLGKLVRRHRAVAAATAITALALVVATLVSSGMYLRAERASHRARVQAEKATQVSSFLQEMLQGVGPSVALGRDTTMLREILDRTAERARTELAGQAEVEAEIQEVLATTYVDLGEFRKAEPHARRLIELRDALGGSGSAAALESRSTLATAQRGLGQYAEADSVLAWVHTHAPALGPEHPVMLEAGVNRVATLFFLSELDPAAAQGEALREPVRRVLGEDSETYHGLLYNLAQVYTNQLRPADAEAAYRELIDRLEKDLGPRHPHTLSAKGSLGWMLRMSQRPPEAAPVLEETLAAMREVLGNDHLETLNTINSLAVTYKDLGRMEEAEPLYLEDLAASRRTLGPRHPELVPTLVNLSAFYVSDGRPADALPLAQEGVELAKEVLDGRDPGLGFALLTRGDARLALGRAQPAYADLAQARELLVAFFGAEDVPAVERCSRSLAEACQALGRSQEAEEWLAKGGE